MFPTLCPDTPRKVDPHTWGPQQLPRHVGDHPARQGESERRRRRGRVSGAGPGRGAFLTASRPPPGEPAMLVAGQAGQ